MARKFFVSVEIGKAVHNMPGVIFDDSYLKHMPDPSWPAADLERCVYELRARCFKCKTPYNVHFNAPDYTSWAFQYRDDWPYEYFKNEAGWDVENGICPECIYVAMARN